MSKPHTDHEQLRAQDTQRIPRIVDADTIAALAKELAVCGTEVGHITLMDGDAKCIATVVVATGDAHSSALARCAEALEQLTHQSPNGMTRKDQP